MPRVVGPFRAPQAGAWRAVYDPSVDKVIDRLRRVLPPGAVLATAEELKPYECDALMLYRRAPLAVVLPAAEAEVAAVLRTCNEAGVPVIARGAGTGLSGGATPNPDAVLMSLARLNRIVGIDPLARTARVQPGVRNLAISEAAAPYGLYYAPDPSSQIACTIGGNVAENSGGVHCLKYGLTVHNLLALRVLTIEGELMEIGARSLDAPGYDLLALLTGSEGLLAVVTEATLRLIPRPECARVVLAAFASLAEAGQAVADVIAAGIIPAGLEMMDRPAIAAVEPFVKAGYPLDAEAILLCECDGTAHEVEEEILRVEAVLQRAGSTECRISRDEAERLRFWAGRKAAFPAMGALSPDYYCMDGSIPRKRLAAVLEAIRKMEGKYALRCTNVFHAGDGNLHPLILFDSNNAREVARAEAFGAEILELCVREGGSITGEHGVGLEKIDQMCVQFGRAELATFHAVKRAFDERGLLNPGKAVPTLHRCAEFGRLHVRGGQLPHPELPRF
ncbi:MAG TPA: FAD-linked oxidase C-terminal domain-containing protein [Steroidobacteraceae bacterium]|nr:FAD-linked oxidase C-terminal domain-containing protein [Steroidobacteraceae bacterium]